MTTTISIEQVRKIVTNQCDVCHEAFQDGDKVCCYSIDPQLPEVWLNRVASGIWLKQISYHTHDYCMGREYLH